MGADRKLRILLVDDEPDILLLLQAMLAAPSWEVVGKAASGEDALRISRDIQPDVAVVDYMMPGMDGLELARGLKAEHPECDIVLFSAYNVGPSPEIDHYLPKSEVGRLELALREIAQAKGLAR